MWHAWSDGIAWVGQKKEEKMHIEVRDPEEGMGGKKMRLILETTAKARF